MAPGAPADFHPVDRCRRRMRLEVEQDQRPHHARVAKRRRQMERALVDRARHEPQSQPHLHRAAIGPLERRRQRLAQPRQHERQRLEALDRVLELEPLDKSHGFAGRHERRDRLAARGLMQDDADRSEPRVNVGARQPGEVAQRVQAPAGQNAADQAPAEALPRSLAGLCLVPGLVCVSHRSGTSPMLLSFPAATIVTPSRACARIHAVVVVAASAMRALDARRRQALHFARDVPGAPIACVRPLASKSTARSSCLRCAASTIARGLERVGSRGGGDETTKQRVLRVRHVRRVRKFDFELQLRTSTCPLPFAPALLHGEPAEPAALQARTDPAARGIECTDIRAGSCPSATRRRAGTESRPSLACASRSQVVRAARADDVTAHRPRRARRSKTSPRDQIERADRLVHRALDHRRPQSSAVSVGPRTHSTRSRSTPAAAADAGSNRSSASTSPTTSPRAVAAASVANNTLVRPVERAPMSSDTSPRRHPPPSIASSAPRPVDTDRTPASSRRPASVPSAVSPGAAIRAKMGQISCSLYRKEEQYSSVREGDQERNLRFNCYVIGY